MKQLLTLAFIALALNSATGQNNAAKYDSTRNFLGPDVYQYVGQELVVQEIKPAGRYEGFLNFYKDYTKEADVLSNEKYAGLTTKYDSIAGHHYRVLAVIPDPQAHESAQHANSYYLKLQDLVCKDFCYYQYDSVDAFRNTFPFMVEGYLQKLKQRSTGKQFVFSRAWFAKSNEYLTEKPLTLVTGEKWKCMDVITDKENYYLSLLLQNTAGQKETVMVDWIFGIHPDNAVFTAEEADKYRKIYGSDNFDIMLSGNVKTGWTGPMCKLAWGAPDHINATHTSAGRSEQWVYTDDHFLYFDEQGKLTTIQ